MVSKSRLYKYCMQNHSNNDKETWLTADEAAIAICECLTRPHALDSTMHQPQPVCRVHINHCKLALHLTVTLLRMPKHDTQKYIYT